MVFQGNLGECIHEFLTKPASTGHLYDVATEPQPAFEAAILGVLDVIEIVARPEFQVRSGGNAH
jgi:hypothetical protein